MCVAVAGRVISIGSPRPGAVMGWVELGDRTLEINLIMLPDVEIGDHVLVHSGYAIRVVRGKIATETTETLLTSRRAVE